MPDRPLRLELPWEEGDDAEGLHLRVGALEFEIREVLTQLASQAAQNITALQELDAAKSQLLQLQGALSRTGAAAGSARPLDQADGADLPSEALVRSEIVALTGPGELGPAANASALPQGEESAAFRVVAEPLVSPGFPIAESDSVSTDSEPVSRGETGPIAELDRFRSDLLELTATLAERTAERDELARHIPNLEAARAERDRLTAERAGLEREAEQYQARLISVQGLFAGIEAERQEIRERLETSEREWQDRLDREQAARLTEAADREARARAEVTERFSLERDALTREMEDLRRQLEVLQSRYREAEAERETARVGVEEEREGARARADAERRELVADSERRLEELRKQFEIERQALIQQLEAERGSQAEHDAVRQEVESMRTLLEKARQERDGSLARAEEMARDRDTLATARAAAEAERDHAAHELRAAQAAAEALAGERDAASRERDEFTVKLEQTARERDELRDRAEGLERELALVRGQLTKAEDHRREGDELVRRNAAALAESAALVESLRQELAETQKRLDDAEQAAASLQTNAERAGEEIKGLRAALERQSDERSASDQEHERQLNRLLEDRERERETLQRRIEAAIAEGDRLRTSLNEQLERARQEGQEALRERDELRARWDQRREERDGPIARSRLTGTAEGRPTTDGLAVDRLTDALAQISKVQVATNQRRNELLEQVRTLREALAKQTGTNLLDWADRPRPKGDAYREPGAYRNDLEQWVRAAEQRRNLVADQVTRLESEILAGRQEIDLVDRDLALCAWEPEEDIVFPIEEED